MDPIGIRPGKRVFPSPPQAQPTESHPLVRPQITAGNRKDTKENQEEAMDIDPGGNSLKRKPLERSHLPKKQAQPAKNQSPPLFDARLSSVVKITESNKAGYAKLFKQKVTEGWRWVSENFINDDDYDPARGYFTHYRVITQDKKPDRSDLSVFKKADVVLVNKIFKDSGTGKDKKHFHYMDSKGALTEGNCSAKWDAHQLKKYFDTNLKSFDLPSNPVLKARQMPVLKEGDSIYIQGKTLQLIKAPRKEEHVNSGQSKTVWNQRELSVTYFEDSYARLAGAYIRHLERLPCLQKAFDRFFEVKQKTSPFCVNLYGSEDVYEYQQYVKVSLKNAPVTPEDLTLIYQALGIRIDSGTLTLATTIENTIPFKKVLELLTCFDPLKYRHCPWLVSFDILGGHRKFLLSRGQSKGDKNQLLVSMEREFDIEENTAQFAGNAYPFWVSHQGKISAEVVMEVLNKPISQSIQPYSNWEKILEFIVCTHVVESHCTPGRLEQSRVPGTGKQARALLRHHIEKGTSLSLSFDATKKTNTRLFPMAGTGGTGDTRSVVNLLLRQEGKASCTDMSEDSDV